MALENRMSLFDFATTASEGLRPEQDKFLAQLSGPLLVCWTVTMRCPLRCLHCLNDSKLTSQAKELNDDEAMELVDQIIEVYPFNVCYCGGEPFLRKELLLRVTKKLTSHGISASTVTSGFLTISEDDAKAFSDAGLEHLQISIDGVTAETHERMRGVRGCFERSLQSARNVIKSGIVLAIAFTPTKFNIPEFPEFVDRMVDLGCRNVRVMPILPLGRALINEDCLFPSGDDYFSLIWKIREKQIEYLKHGIMVEWGDPLEHIYTYAVMKQNPFTLDIETDGEIFLSPYLPVTVGNIKRHTLKEYWDAGVRRMWQHPKTIEQTQNAITVDSLRWLSPKPYLEGRLTMDLFEELSKTGERPAAG